MTDRGDKSTATKGARLLVVDDDPTVRRVLVTMLDREGYQTETAENGAEAVERCAERAYDVIIMDVMMPKMDGIEACEHIKATERGRFTPVVFVTAVTDRKSRIQAKAAGGDDFLRKPIDALELRTRVANLVKVKRYHDLVERRSADLQRELDALTGDMMRAERLATVGSLASAVAHDLANVGSVLNGAVLLLDRSTAAGDPPAPAVLESLRETAAHLDTHARKLLHLFDPGPDREDRLDLAAMARDTVATLQAIGKTRQVPITVTAPPTAVLVWANAVQLEQVVMNIVLNAVEATIDLRGRPRPIAIEVAHREEDGRALLSVTDEAGGIPKDVCARVFEPYFTTKGSGRGTGLGLTVARQIAEGYGGHLDLETELGVGTTVRIELPAAPARD